MRSVKIYLVCLFLGISGIVPLARAQRQLLLQDGKGSRGQKNPDRLAGFLLGHKQFF